MHGDGNGWVECDLRHRHWGRYGAAGILITDGSAVMLQLRAAWTHDGGTWAFPGGARDSNESAQVAALREAVEETTLITADVSCFAESVDEHGRWAYTTVLAHCSSQVPIAPHNLECDATRWVPIADVSAQGLHHGFARSWPTLRALIADHYL